MAPSGAFFYCSSLGCSILILSCHSLTPGGAGSSSPSSHVTTEMVGGFNALPTFFALRSNRSSSRLLSIRFFLLINGATRTSIFLVFALRALVMREKKVFLSFLPFHRCSAGRLTERSQPAAHILCILPSHGGDQRIQSKDGAILRDPLQCRKVRKNGQNAPLQPPDVVAPVLGQLQQASAL